MESRRPWRRSGGEFDFGLKEGDEWRGGAAPPGQHVDGPRKTCASEDVPAFHSNLFDFAPGGSALPLKRPKGGERSAKVGTFRLFPDFPFPTSLTCCPDEAVLPSRSCQTKIQNPRSRMPTKPSPALAILILLLLSALVSQLIATLSWGHASFQLTEWLINYSGGFVRRGLPGALIGSISETTRIQANYIAIFLGLVFYLVLATYLLLRATPTFPAILILSCIVIGLPAYQDSIVRKDCLGLLFLIGILSVDRSRLPRTTAILVINLLAGVAILSHETFVFYALAAFILFRHRDREEVTLADFTRRSLSLLPAAGCFLLTVIYHGTPEQAEAVNQSWLPLWRLTDPGNLGLETPSAAISALGWTSEQGLSLSLYLLTSGFYQPMAWTMVFVIAFGLVILFTDRDNNASASNSGFKGICRKPECKQPPGHRAQKCPMNRPEPEPAKQAPAKSKARQVANVVAEQESSAAGQGAGNVTLSDKQFQELLSRAAKNGK